jgi:hypothetical protein
MPLSVRGSTSQTDLQAAQGGKPNDLETVAGSRLLSTTGGGSEPRGSIPHPRVLPALSVPQRTMGVNGTTT